MRPAGLPAAGLAVAGLAVAGLAHAGPAAAFLPGPRRWLLPRLAGLGDPGHVALTFDDGPSRESTPLFLDVLDSYRVRATFFLLGREVRRAPGVAAEIVARGHEVGVHGWDHRCLLVKGPRRTWAELRRARDVIEEVAGTAPRWFRPAYGVFSGVSVPAARALGLTPVLWSTWGFDWTRRATGASVLRTVTRNLDGGGTILLHDSDVAAAPGAWRSTLDALPRLLDECARRGLAVGPLRAHRVGSRGASYLDGVVPAGRSAASSAVPLMLPRPVHASQP
jgi:peptidoglycan/xylan/chitin deacetylase (PgdA/CDA1 family)